jgi:hypothetical protein
MYSIAGKRTAMPTEHELYLLRDTVRVERFQFLIEDVGECLKARASRVKFVVPRTPLRRQGALAVYEIAAAAVTATNSFRMASSGFSSSPLKP